MFQQDPVAMVSRCKPSEKLRKSELRKWKEVALACNVYRYEEREKAADLEEKASTAVNIGRKEKTKQLTLAGQRNADLI